MFRELFSFEIKYHFRQLLVAGTAVIFFALGFLVTKANFGGPDVLVNSPYAITFYIALLSLFILVVLTILSASVLLRDRRERLEEIIFSTRVSKLNYLGTRFGGIVVTSLAILLLSAIGMILGSMLAPPDRVGPSSIWDYMLALVVFGIPNILFSASILFAAAIFFRTTLSVYVTGALIYIFYMVGSVVGNSPLMASANLDGPSNNLLAVLLDPFGLVGFMGQARFWTTVEKNTLSIIPEGAFLANRIMWTFISMALMVIVYRAFAFRTVRTKTLKSRWSLRGRHGSAIDLSNPSSTYQPLVQHWTGFRAQLASWISATQLQAKVTVRSIPFAILMLMWLFIATITITERLFSGPFDTVTYTTTGQIVTLILGLLGQLGVFVVIFYAGELVWSERSLRAHELVDTTPTSTAAIVLSKLTTLAVVVMLFVVAGILVGLGIQIANGYTRFDLPTYLSMFYYAGLPLMCISMLAIAVQNLLNNKYVAILVTVAIVVIVSQPRTWGFEHPMLRFASMPTLSFSDMSGFGFAKRAFNYYIVYWTSLSVFLLILTSTLYRRGTVENFATRIRQASLPRKAIIGLAISLIVFAGSGYRIYDETNVDQVYRSRASTLDHREEYERLYRAHAKDPTPTIISVDTKVDLFPGARRYTIVGTYEIANTGPAPMSSFIVSLHPEVNASTINVTGASYINADPVHGIYSVHLAKPLDSDSTTTLSFEVDVRRSGFSRFNSENSILENGSYIELEDFMPFFGYDASKEISDRHERYSRGLLPQSEAPIPETAAPENYALVEFYTIISAPSDQKLVSVGELLNEWAEDGRSYYEYRSPQPTNFQFAIALADYDVATATSDGITYEIYYHPEHETNVSDMLTFARQSIDLFAREFGPYPYDYYRIAEIPAYVGAATAYPGVVFVTERVGFLLDTRDTTKINQLQLLAAHETAHQWWAHQLRPAEIAGYSVLTESLAQYSELLYLYEYSSSSKTRQHLTNELDFYLSSRSYLPEEPPLYHAWGPTQTHLYYQKASLSMFALMDLIGADSLNSGLQKLLREFTPPYRRPTTIDLLESLHSVSPVDKIHLIDELLKDVILYDIAVSSAKVTEIDGGYRTDITIGVAKYSENESGDLVDVEMNQEITIALLADHPNSSLSLDSPLAMERHVLRNGQNSVTIVSREKPVYVVADPFSFMPDRDRYDNILRLEEN